MKFEIRSSEFKDMLNHVVSAAHGVSGVAEWKNCVLIQAEEPQGEFITLRAVNDVFAVTARCLTSFPIDECGEALVNAKMLYNIISKLNPKANCKISLKEGTLRIKTASGNYKLTTMEVSNFVYPSWESRKTATVQVEKLKWLMERTRDTVFDDESRRALCGILLGNSEGKLYAKSTDGIRVSEASVTADGETFENQIIIPRETVGKLLRMIGSYSECKISTDGKRMRVECGGSVDSLSIDTVLVNGTFMDFSKLFRTNGKTKLYVNKDSLKKALEAVASTSENKNAMMSVCDGKITINCNGMIAGGTEEVECSVSGEDLEIAFDKNAMCGLLGAIEDEEIIMDFSGNLSPAMILPCGKNDKGNEYRYLIAPMRVLR